jgi:hypothetical protein
MTAVSASQALSPRRWTYFNVSRAPRYSVLFALPLLLAYEALAAVLAQPGKGELRNGADAILRSFFTMVAGPRGSLIFISLVCLIGVGFIVRDLRKNRGGLSAKIFVGMLAESTALALGFGFVIGLATAKLLGILEPSLAIGNQLENMSWTSRLMLSLGAGLYEELFFRVLLVSGLTAGAKLVFGFGTRAAATLAVIVGAFIFSAFHYVGPYGDPFEVQSFTFRMLSGLAFSGLYVLRGFGITAWTHALYDAFLLLL